MANKIESSEVSQQKKVFVKSEAVLDEMEASGQLEPFTDYYTDDEQDAPFMPVGSIFTSAIPQEDARVHLLDGSTIPQNGVYATFANLIKALDASGKLITCTQEEFDDSLTTYGQCGKFVIDNDNNTIRLPRITEFIASNNSGQTIGLAELDSFKSHNHTMQSAGSHTHSTTLTYSGVSGSWNNSADLVTVSRNAGTTSKGTSSAGSHTHTIDAKGDAETKPKNVRYPYYIVLASGYKSSRVVEIDKFVTDINNLANEVANCNAKLDAKKLYQHNLCLYSSAYRVFFRIMNNSSTAFTVSTLKTYLQDNSFNATGTGTSGWYQVSGGTTGGGATFSGLSSNNSSSGSTFRVFYSVYNAGASSTTFDATGLSDNIVNIF